MNLVLSLCLLLLIALPLMACSQEEFARNGQGVVRNMCQGASNCTVNDPDQTYAESIEGRKKW